MIDSIMNNPRELGYHEIEKMADDMLRMFAKNGMTYDQAWKIIKSHKEVFEEASKHLNHNAAVEMKAHPVKFVLGGDE